MKGGLNPAFFIAWASKEDVTIKDSRSERLFAESKRPLVKTRIGTRFEIRGIMGSSEKKIKVNSDTGILESWTP